MASLFASDKGSNVISRSPHGRAQSNGKQIGTLGFADVCAFVAHIARGIQQVWQVPGISQLLATVRNGRKDMMYVRLEVAKDGDFYRVNSALPVRQEDYETRNGMKKVWDGSEPTSAATGRRPAFAAAANASPENTSSQGSPNARGQNSSKKPPKEHAGPNTSTADEGNPPYPRSQGGIINATYRQKRTLTMSRSGAGFPFPRMTPMRHLRLPIKLHPRPGSKPRWNRTRATPV